MKFTLIETPFDCFLVILGVSIFIGLSGLCFYLFKYLFIHLKNKTKYFNTGYLRRYKNGKMEMSYDTENDWTKSVMTQKEMIFLYHSWISKKKAMKLFPNIFKKELRKQNRYESKVANWQ